ncbi:lipopolysaccharide biosynthesis protein [Sphingobium sp. HBC34]|uniref:Lipopolysaccharide biosynthesis protein n=1 Tax=Sphingobium cyanobacteriorum TaxID=3063954 RepID=A0ABT8ZNA1_9SPHN|nr:lipopolysaccharide biosynthesis protein [Sphingobium sp. HBC34]MDO7836027.1 lipopolysaccharide biosynthesis protein [Sphingobium sp. HBC34]
MNKLTDIVRSSADPDVRRLAQEEDEASPRPASDAIKRYVWRLRYFLAIVMLPTLIVALYFALFAANQYESEAHLVVRSNSGGKESSGGLDAVLKSFGTSDSSKEAATLADYMRSHDVVASLRRNDQLVERYRRPEADLISRLPVADPTDETLLKYFKSRSTIDLDPDTGIMTVKVRSFRPADSYALINAMLALGEKRVNALNLRSYESMQGLARRQVADAEKGLRDAQAGLTAFRRGQGDVDPQGSAEAQLKLVTELRKEEAMARAEMDAIASQIGSDNPQYRALQSRAVAINSQLNSQQGFLVGNSRSIATRLGDYQDLELRREFESKRYAAAAAALESAREQATRQQLFVVRLVEPNMPEKATYPKGMKTIFTVFLALAIAYGIGWLLSAGVREHSA